MGSASRFQGIKTRPTQDTAADAIIYLLFFVFNFSLFINQASHAQPLDDEGTITEFRTSDEDFLQKRYELLQEAVNNELTTRFNGEKAHDLELLQKLIDSRAIKSDQRKELQAMGVVLGRTLAREFKLHWVVFRDSKGRSRALQIDDTTQLLYPLTMLSRRLEVGARANVQEIYAKVRGIIEYTRANHALY